MPSISQDQARHESDYSKEFELPLGVMHHLLVVHVDYLDKSMLVLGLSVLQDKEVDELSLEMLEQTTPLAVNQPQASVPEQAVRKSLNDSNRRVEC